MPRGKVKSRYNFETNNCEYEKETWIEVTDSTKEKARYTNYSTVCAKQRITDILNKGIAAQAIRRHC